jgi:hypothetical protein
MACRVWYLCWNLTTVKWVFEGLDTLRRTIIARAGRLTRPQGKLTLTLNANPTVQHALLRLLQA